MSIFVKDSTVKVESSQGDLLNARLMFALGFITAIYQKHGHDCIITSALDGRHNPGSLHPDGRAVDIRTLGLDNEVRAAIVSELQTCLRPLGFDVIPEKCGSTPATTAVHLHVEYDPHGRMFWRQSK